MLGASRNAPGSNSTELYRLKATLFDSIESNYFDNFIYGQDSRGNKDGILIAAAYY
jgi:hypothetical protein